MAKTIALDTVHMPKDRPSAKANKGSSPTPKTPVFKNNKFLLPTLGVFLVLSLFFSFLFLFKGNPFKKGEPADVLVQQPAGVCSLRFVVEGETPLPPPPKEAYIQCKSLEGVLVDRGAPINSSKKYSLSSIPNDFKGTLWLTCIGEAKNATIEKVNFKVTKTLGSDVKTATKTVTPSKEPSCASGLTCYKGVTSFDVEGPGNFKVSSQVCGTSNGTEVCSSGDPVKIENGGGGTDG